MVRKRNLGKVTQQNPDLEVHIIDGTAHACAAGYGKDSQAQEALGRSKGGFTTKIHALVDALGNPLKFILTPGQRNEITQAEVLTKNITNSTVVADKGYMLLLPVLKAKDAKLLFPQKRIEKCRDTMMSIFIKSEI